MAKTSNTLPAVQTPANPAEGELTIEIGMSLQMDPIENPETQRNMTDAKVQCVRAFPFIAYLIMSTMYRSTKSIPTACATVQGQNDYIAVNDEFFNKRLTSLEQRIFVVMHEHMHIFLHHIGRQTEACYHAGLWNVATDYMINAFLFHIGQENMDNNRPRIELPKFGLFDERFYKKSADEIYHILLQENGGDANKACEAHGGNSDIVVVMQGGKGGGNGQKNGGKPGQMPMDAVGKTPMSTADKMSVNQKIAASMTAASTQNNKNIGDAAAELMRLFNSYIEERVDWRAVLREWIVSACKSRNTYNRASRRSSNRVIFPSMTGDHINLLFAGDSSGSMGNDELGEVQNELRAVMSCFESWEIEYGTCDTNFHSLGHFSSENGDTYENITVDMIGGGGTDMNPIIEYANDCGDFFNLEGEIVTIIVTDAYIPAIVAEVEHPTLIVVVSSGDKNFTCDNENVMVIKMEK